MPPTEKRPRSQKYEFADGLRAIAALAIAAYHAMTFTGHFGDVKAALPGAWWLLQIGNYAVPVFIVLSGFVLMLPVARTENFEIRGGFLKYIGRRARRILPPYYAALLLFLVMIWLVPILQEDAGTAWDNKVPVTWGGVVSHVFAVHNLSPDWIYQINGPAWSIATEWQIYFLLPWVLLPLWRRIGPWWTVAAALLVGQLITRFFPSVSAAHFWFIGLFAMGMLAAHLTIRGSRFKAGVPAAVTVVAALGWLYISPATAELWSRFSETIMGLAVALGLLWLASASLEGRRTWLHRVLEARVLVWIGLWSYSLYLIHSPILGLANLLLLPLGLPTWLQLALMLGAVLPVACALGYLFHRLVERHFLTGHQKAELKERRAERRRPTPASPIQPVAPPRDAPE